MSIQQRCNKVNNELRFLQEHRFQFTAIHAMVPTAHLLVSYIRDDGELVADSLDFEVGSLLQNFVSPFSDFFE